MYNNDHMSLKSFKKKPIVFFLLIVSLPLVVLFCPCNAFAAMPADGMGAYGTDDFSSEQKSCNPESCVLTSLEDAKFVISDLRMPSGMKFNQGLDATIVKIDPVQASVYPSLLLARDFPPKTLTHQRLYLQNSILII